MNVFEPGDSVRYKGRLFVVVLVTRDTLLLQDDEGRHLNARANQVTFA